ncbi:MAG: EF-P 5-aminopentanol modification-associated protein YfmF [Clostridia bacterium]
MSYKTEEIKKSVKLHCIGTEKFKTNLIAVFLSTPLDRKTVTYNAIIPAVLRRGTNNLKSQEKISIALENMYGATFDCGVEKTGDNQILKFYLEMVNDEFLETSESNLTKGINLLLDIIFNPLVENNQFNEEYLKTEKENMKQIIEAKIDNKDRYAFERCIEEMYKNKIYGLYKYGYVEDLSKINGQNLYEHYKKLINTAKIDIFVSGNIKEDEVLSVVKRNENIQKLQPRTDIHIINAEKSSNFNNEEPKTIEEKMDVTQGKLVIGTDVNLDEEDSKYKISLYNVVLGEGATSKLFQNVRERESLAYTARSNYVKPKNNIYIRCGIEIQNFEKAVDVIKEQLEAMKNGDFTEEDIENAKKYVVAGLRTTREEQDSELTYYLGQELSDKFTTFEEYEEKINKVTKEDIQKVAQNIKINTIYFLRN